MHHVLLEGQVLAMAIKRQTGVEFIREGLRTTTGHLFDEPTQTHGPTEEDIARKRAALIYGPMLLRTLREVNTASTEGVSPRKLFDDVRGRIQLPGGAAFDDFRLALGDAYDNRYVEVVGSDDYGDPLYTITKLGLSVAPP
jgi:hypothetical protein